MRFIPTKSQATFLCFIFISVLVVLSCSKDSDLLLESVLSDDPVVSVEEQETQTEEPVLEEAIIEEPLVQESIEELFEVRTTSFPPTNDAHVQSDSGKGYNQTIIRLEEGNRTSYLMFDLTAIAEIEAEITEATLQFTVNSDNGSGNITVYKGKTTNWTEENLTQATIPNADVELGSITKEYSIGATEEIPLSAANLSPELATLILDHQDGNDLAFASKEHASETGPQLVVSYIAPIDAAEIVPQEEEVAETPSEEPTTEEPTNEEPTNEEPTNEEPTNEEPIIEAPTNEEPMAIADGTPTTGKAPLEVSFSGSNSSDDNGITSYLWNFKDGATSTAANPKHTFTETGTYRVTLTVKDEEGVSNTDTVTITITEEENKAPVAVVSATPKSGVTPLEVTFKGSDSTDDNAVTSYAWDFKDGGSATNANPKHTFDEAGTYEVVLTVKDENGASDTEDITITVTEPQNEAPVAKVSANRTSGEIPLVVQFTGNTSTDDKAVTSYTWSFKDGSSSSSANPSHTFDTAGTYNVALTVRDAEGLSSTKSISITASAPNNNPPKAVGTPNITSGEAPLTVNFTGNKSTDDKAITGYTWNFKDGATSTEANPSHTFENPGTYQVTLTVTDANGATDSDTDTITVTAPSSSGGGDTGGGGGNNGNHPPNAVFASSFGFKAGDATEAFQDALKSNHSYIVIDKQSSDWIIKPTRLFNVDNKTIVFEEGVVLRAKSGAYGAHNAVLFNLFESDNVIIKGYGATLRMNKSEYGKSEFRHALLLDGCKNITIQGLTIRDSGGDGINLNTSPSRKFSENITIEDVTSTNNSRMGLTVISGKDVWVRNSTFSGSKGQAPEAGIALEPNNNLERLQNLNFVNCKVSSNNGPGFYVGVINLTKSSIPLSVNVTGTEFIFNSQNNNYGRPHAELRLSDNPAGNNNVTGTITFDGLQFNGSKSRIIWSQKTDEAYKVIFRNCSAKNVSNSEANPIQLEGKIVSSSLGGFDFGNFYIEYTKNKSFMKLTVPVGTKAKNITGNFTIKEPGDNPIDYNERANPKNGVNVNLQYNHIN